MPYLPLRLYLVILVIAALLPALTITVYNQHSLRQEHAAEVERNASALAGLVSNELQQLTMGMKQMFVAVSAAPIAQTLGEECGPYVSRLRDAFPSLSNVGITDANGVVKCLNEPFSPGLSIADRRHFTIARETGSFAVGTVFVGRVTGRKVIGFAQPIFSAGSGAFKGVVFGSVRVDSISERLAALPALRGTRLVLTDVMGQVAVSLPNDAAAQSLPVNWRDLAAASGPITHRSESRAGAPDQIFGIVPYTMPPLGLALFLGVDPGSSMKALDSAVSRSLIGYSTAFILGIGLALLLWWYFIEKTLLRVLLVSKQVQEGNLSARTELAPRNEITQIAHTLDGVLDHLAEQIARRDGAEHQARLARDEALRVSAAKTDFLAAVSHDLRQPLQTVSLIGQLFASGRKLTDTAKLAKTLDAAVQDMGKMLDHLSDVAQLERGQLVPVLTPLPLGVLFDKIREEFAPLAEQAGVLLEVRDVDACVVTDAALLQRILHNLLQNAMKFTPKGGSVIVAAEQRANGEVSVHVADTGVGIPENQQKEVFLEFRQLGNPERDRRKGFGLGLAIVERLCALLNHSISLQSKPGVGSTFTVELGQAAPPKRPDSRDIGQHTFTLDARILVVDDDESIAQTTSELLSLWGASPVTAGNADDAIHRLQQEHFDAVLSDFRLPGRSGVDVLQFAREKMPGTLRILISGDVSESLIALCNEKHMKLLRKPVSAEELMIALRPLRRQPRLQVNLE